MIIGTDACCAIFKILLEHVSQIASAKSIYGKNVVLVVWNIISQFGFGKKLLRRLNIAALPTTLMWIFSKREYHVKLQYACKPKYYALSKITCGPTQTVSQ